MISGLWVGDCFVPDLAEQREVGEAECTCLQLLWLARFALSYISLSMFLASHLATQGLSICAMLLRSTSPMPSA